MNRSFGGFKNNNNSSNFSRNDRRDDRNDNRSRFNNNSNYNKPMNRVIKSQTLRNLKFIEIFVNFTPQSFERNSSDYKKPRRDFEDSRNASSSSSYQVIKTSIEFRIYIQSQFAIYFRIFNKQKLSFSILLASSKKKKEKIQFWMFRMKKIDKLHS